MTRFSRPLSAVIAATLALSLTAPLHADDHSGSATYDFQDPKGVNAVLIVLDSDLEPFVGMANGITGEVTYDTADPTSFTGSIQLDVQSIQLSNERMTQVMRGAGWINAEAFNTITMTFDEVTEAQTEDGVTLLAVDATLAIMGKQLERELEIEVEYFKDGGKNRGGAESGDLIKLTSVFEVTREELGIKPEMGDSVVANEIEILVMIVGYEKVAETE
ncbi:MAG: YceI family protein [Planctomycetota bacterium]